MNKHTLTILEILHSAATSKADPKPALRDIANLCPETGLLSIRLADEIESRFSQVKALHASELPDITEEHLSVLAEFEAQDKLAEGYEAIFALLRKENLNKSYGSCPEFPEFPFLKKLSLSELKEFWKNLALCQEIHMNLNDSLNVICDSATTQTLKKACADIRSALQEDGTTIAAAIKKTKMFDHISVKTAEFAETTGQWSKASKARLEELKSELEKRNINWKVAAGILGGAILGSLLAKRK